MKKMITLVCIICTQLVQAQNIAANADAFLLAYTTQHKFSGVVLIAKHDNIIFNKAYGYADVDNNRSNTINTEFRAGSLTKMFTSALIMQLINDGKLGLNDMVSKYIPAATWANGVTIKNLLSHTSGINGTTPAQTISLPQMVEGFQAGTPHFKPGTQFEYNNFNYILLSYIAQKITGIAYPVLVKDKVLDKAGMHHSGIDSFQRRSNDKALGYALDPNNNQWMVTGNDETVAAASGAGALFTTAADLFEWSKYVEQQLQQDNTSFKTAITPVVGDYGLGWMNQVQNGHQMIGHTGSIPGFVAMLMLFPEDSTTVIFLSNFQDMNTNEFVNNLAALALNEPYEMPVEKKKIDLPVEVLKEYVGTYGEDASAQLKFILENDKLIVLAPGGDRVPLAATSKDNFFIDGPGIIIRFNRDGDTISSVFVSMGNQTLKKIE